MTEQKTKHQFICSDGKFQATGVKEVKEFTDTYISCNLESGGLYVEGRGLNVVGLDVTSGVLEVTGTVTSVRYGSGKESLLKRLFR